MDSYTFQETGKFCRLHFPLRTSPQTQHFMSEPKS